MSINLKKYAKTVLAAFLALTLVVSTLAQTGFSTKASNTGYKEMTFGDWGVKEGDVYSLTDPTTITSLDGVAINGTINMNGLTWGDSIISFGGTEAVKNDGIWLVNMGAWGAAGVSNGGFTTGWLPMTKNQALCQTNGDVGFRITFDKADNANDWTVKMYADDAEVFSNTFTNLNLGLYIGIAPGVTVSSGQKEEAQYDEKTFRDWATSEGVIYDCDVYSLTDSEGITDLDGIAISGKVDFDGKTGSLFRIGGNEVNKHGGFTFMTHMGGLAIWSQAIGAEDAQFVVQPAEWSTLINEKFDFRIAFDKAESADNWTVTVYINNVKKLAYEFKGVTPGLYIANFGVKMDGLGEGEYTEMEFGDWGKKEGTIENHDVYRLTDAEEITSLNGVQVGGTVDFAGNKESYFRVGGNDNLKYGGFALITHPETGDLVLWAQGIGTDSAQTVMPKADWDELINTEFDVKMAFSKATSDDPSVENWKIFLRINDELLGDYDFPSVKPGLYIANVGVAITGLGKDEVAENYTELKFSDWGVSEGLSGVHNIFSLTDKNAISSLDGVAISGKINFNGTQWKYITVGGTADVKHGGFWLMGTDEGGWRMACQGIGTNYGDSIAWSEGAKINSEVELRMTFDKAPAGNTWTVRVYGDGIPVGTWQYDDITPGLYIGVDSLITLEGLDTAPPEFEGEYKEIKFSDFSRYEGELFGSDTYSLVGHDDIKNLDGVAISGKVNYNGLDSRISIGGTDMWKHTGFWLFSANDCLRLSPQEIGNVVIDHWMIYPEQWNELKNKDIDLRVTFDKDPKKGAWWVGVYVNGEHLGQFNCGVVEPGMAIGVGKGITVEGLGDAVINASIDFRLFGYSNENWRKEMGLE